MTPTADVLCLLAEGFEEIEAVTPVDLLRRAGLEVVVAGVDGVSAVRGRCGMALVPDTSLEKVLAAGTDTVRLLLLPGGPGVARLRAEPRVIELVAAWHASGRPVAAICAAPLVLADAGLLGGGRRFTAHASVAEEFPGSSDARLEEDGGIVSSRGAGTALDFGLALVRLLRGDQAADEIAASIHA